MEGEQIGPGMGLGSLRKPTASRASAVLQMRGPNEPLSLMGYGGDNHDQERSFTQLLSGAMASPNSEGRDDGGNSGHRTLGSGGGSFAARFAARTFSQKDMDMGGGGGTGYSGPASDQPKVQPPSRISISDSYQLTIPPGLSPTQLLESPVFLSNAQQAEPSPTTGNFNLPPYVGEVSKDRGNDEGSTPGFVFRPFPKAAAPRNTLSPLAGMVQQSYGQSQQPFSYSHAQGQSGGQQLSTATMSSAVSLSGQGPGPTMSSGPPVAVALAMPPMASGRQQPEPVRDRSPEQELHLPVSVPFIERPSEDGYNWRKYGQKQVKGSEYPRSYYKCTHAGCPMKKKVERSHDGQVTEIVYKGEHNHPKPQPTRRLAVAQVAAAHHLSDNAGDRTDGDGKEWGGFQTGAGDSGYYRANGGGDDPSSSVRRPFGLSLGPNGTPEPSSPSESEDGSKSVTEDGDDDEPDSKRRKKEKKMIKELPPAPRTIREPRVVVQTTSDVDILDDGYRWRKYGQKVVKGNPHPRSYYKCTHMNCPVRKHVERASNDPKAVITTYEGKHNHDVPVARNSSHDAAGLGPGTAPPPSQSGASSMPQSQPEDLYGKRLSVFGRLLEDGSSKGENGVSDTHLGMGVGMGSMDDSGSHNHLGKPEHQNINMPMNYQSSLQGRSMMDSYGGGPGMQDLGLRPKQEQDDPHNHNSLEMNPYHAQRLAVMRQ